MKKLSLNYGLCVGALLLAGGAGYIASEMLRPTPMVTIGRVEKVYVEDAKFKASARIDTGAGVSSINAEIIEIRPPEDKGDKEVVVFKVLDDEDHIITLKREIVDWQNIKKKAMKDGYLKRPVVMMDFCIAGKRVEARVNLADREHFLYPVLIGRNVLKAGDFVIDPAKTFTHKPTCPKRKRG